MEPGRMLGGRRTWGPPGGAGPTPGRKGTGAGPGSGLECAGKWNPVGRREEKPG